MVEKKFDRVIIFEDDLRFVVNSTDLLKELIEDIDISEITWDLIYLGRKQFADYGANFVDGKIPAGNFFNHMISN